MKQGVVPPSPKHVGDMINEVLVRKGLVNKKYVNTMNNFYRLMKRISHREIKSISGQEYEKYRSQAVDFVNVMRKVVEMK